jgi:hypothetical protein
MNLFGPLFALYLRRVGRRLRRMDADPGGIQRRTLAALLGRARNTWFGRRHGFASLRGHADFAKAVPIADYVANIDMYRRIIGGEPDVSWPGRVGLFARTSGTTAGDKWVPVTDGLRRGCVRAVTAMFAYNERQSPGLVSRLLAGRMLYLTAPTVQTPMEAGGRVGHMSGIAAHWVPWPGSRRYEPGFALADVADWEERIGLMARHLVGRDVRWATGIPPWVRVLFDRVCQAAGVPTEGGLSRVWPNLEVYVHGGTSLEPYRATFDRYFRPGHRVRYQEVYPASEGFIAVQPRFDEPGMAVMCDGGLFYEFVPLAEWGKADAPRLPIHEVERGVPYCVVLSSNAGLWAYDLGDVVRFVSVRPPRILFHGRHMHTLNAFVEHVGGHEVGRAVAAAAEATGARVVEFTVAPVCLEGRRLGAHEYVVEFERMPDGGLPAFAQAADASLRSSNTLYALNRTHDFTMAGPVITPVPRGTFMEWMKRRGKLGEQNKVPTCVSDRRFADAVLAVAAERGVGRAAAGPATPEGDR